MNVTEKHEALPEKSRLLWYETGIVLGRGGFGITYLARDNNLNQLVAIKEYFPVDFAARAHQSPFLSMPRATASAYQTGLKRFIREARTLSLFKHPNIVRVNNVFQCNNTAYMVMDYEEGESLDYLFENQQLKTEKQLLDIVLPILDGLRVVHEAGFVHRDIKPSNVYVRKDGSPVLLDFGSARQTTPQQLSKATTHFVTPAYAPFEQYASSGGKQGPWSDIYSLGATLYLIVTDNKPAEALTRGVEIAQHATDPYQPAAKIATRAYSANFLAAIDRALMFHPGRRPQSAEAWSRMLSDERARYSVTDSGRRLLRNIAKRLAATPKPRRHTPASPNNAPPQNKVIRLASTPAAEKATGAGGFTSARNAERIPFGNRKVLIASVAPVVVMLALIALAYALPTDTRSEQPDKEVADTPAPATAQPNSGEAGPLESSALAAFEQTAATDAPGAEAATPTTVNQELITAEQLLSQDRLTAAREHLQAAARLEPDNVNLARLRAELAAREQELEISALLADAERRLVTDQLAEPAQDSALAIYRQVLDIEPDNAAAQAGLQTLVERYVELADRLLATDQLDQAEQAVRMVEIVKPDNVEASPLRQRISSLARAIELAGVLADADEQFAAGQLTQPPGDNALALYRQVLASDPHNAAAHRGVQNVIRHYLDAANDLLAAEQTARAEEQLAVVDDIDFGNPQAQGLRARIKAIAQKEAKKKRQQKIAKQKLAAARQRAARQALEQKEQQREAAAMSDADRVTGLIEKFKLAFEQRDIQRLQRVAHLSAKRRQFIEDLFVRHKAIQVSISEISLERRGTASARITIEELITNDGDSVIPAPTWKQARLVTVKKGQHWQKLSW